MKKIFCLVSCCLLMTINGFSQTEDNEKTVKFTIVDEVPVIKGCENSRNKKKCFQKKVAGHYKREFKTSVIKKFTHSSFEKEYIKTLGAQLSVYLEEIEGEKITL